MHGLDPCIHADPLALVFQGSRERFGVDGRDKPGHDAQKTTTEKRQTTAGTCIQHPH